MSEEERYEEAKTCEDCISWHKHCDAECCKRIMLTDSLERYNKSSGLFFSIKLNRNLRPSEQWYYQLHDVKYSRGVLSFLKERIHIKDGRLYYLHPCKYLKDNQCIGHPINKPETCRALTKDNLGDGRFFVTENCLFKYKKCKEETNHEKESRG